ncbi:CocE/NonD family hydrolase [Microlunatus speluncae]|uniref:CocE/NonD family hydrolase n=1 Tax=Microlunatus speluncae TaxID=2594267 RepID=UPI001266808F|nr:CocE/NonD family hydrolase [Microlunatus speluncae]
MITFPELMVGPVERLLGLGPPRVARYRVESPPIELPDGTTLAADHYRPEGIERGPVVLVRTPYGKHTLMGFGYGMLLARRGLQAVVQDVRGTFASAGEFDAFRQERADGVATAEWIRRQPWCDGRLAMTGASYLGLTQWAVAAHLDPPLAAITPAITGSTFTPNFYPGGSLALQLVASWSSGMGVQEERRNPVDRLRHAFRVGQAMSAVPLTTAMPVAIDRQVRVYDDLIGHAEPGDDFWAPAEHDQQVADRAVPASLFAGWHDLFIAQQLRDFTALQAAGVPSRLTVGPWIHGEFASLKAMFTDQLGWLEGQLLGDTAALQRAPVRLFLQGAGRWLDFDRWPVPVDRVAWSLGADGRVTPGEAEPGRREFRYDPADPTPTVGGNTLSTTAGPKDNRVIEARADVLTYDSARFEEPLDLIGEVTARIVVSTETADADVFVRICDVEPSGRSINVTDGLRRLRATDGPDDRGDRVAEVELNPTAYRFRPGHRLRIQVAGGAFPNYSRNHQTGEPIATATILRAGTTTIRHGRGTDSSISLPVYGRGPRSDKSTYR